MKTDMHILSTKQIQIMTLYYNPINHRHFSSFFVFCIKEKESEQPDKSEKEERSARLCQNRHWYKSPGAEWKNRKGNAVRKDIKESLLDSQSALVIWWTEMNWSACVQNSA